MDLSQSDYLPSLSFIRSRKQTLLLVFAAVFVVALGKHIHASLFKVLDCSLTQLLLLLGQPAVN